MGGTVQIAISPWKKGSGGPKFLDFSEFIRNFQKIKKKLFFHSVLGWCRRCGHIVPPLHSSYIQKPRTTRLTPFPSIGFIIGIPCHFPFMWGMVFTLNVSNWGKEISMQKTSTLNDLLDPFCFLHLANFLC